MSYANFTDSMIERGACRLAELELGHGVWPKLDDSQRLLFTFTFQTAVNAALHKKGQAAAWPVGCHSANSCDRHQQCMYVNCKYENQDIKADIAAAKAALDTPNNEGARPLSRDNLTTKGE
jgi:hypothetical protein